MPASIAHALTANGDPTSRPAKRNVSELCTCTPSSLLEKRSCFADHCSLIEALATILVVPSAIDNDSIVRLPGRLKATTLGDVLGALHRSRMNGTLELAEDSGRTHRIFVQAGMVIAVELDAQSPALGEILKRDRVVDEDVLKRSVLRSISSQRLLGEVLVTDFRISPAIIGAALRRQVLHRLQVLEQIEDARVLFRVAVRTPKSALTDDPIKPDEFLSGRKRARDRRDFVPTESGCFPIPRLDPRRAAALALLELGQDADPLAIKRAYRRLARELHPDLHPHVSEGERSELHRRFSELTDAYRTLVA
jgi:hypothetical protein